MKLKFTPYIYILIFFNFNLYAQKLSLKLNASLPENNKVLQQISYKKTVSGKKELYFQIDSIRHILERKGYLQHQIQNIDSTAGIFTLTIRLNSKIKTIRIRHDGKLDENILKRISKNYNRDFFEISFEQIESTLNEILHEFELRGNSFIQTHLGYIELHNGMAYANLILNKSTKRKIDKIFVKGYENFPESFIKYRLHLKKGDTFNLNALKYASAEVKSLDFTGEIKPPEVLFTGDSTFVYLFLKKKRSNTFDGLIGFSSKKEGSGLDLNGYLDIRLRSIFNRGEHISLLWKSNGNDSQQFNLSTAIPYIFNSPVSPEFSLNIYKQDTSFSNINLDLSVYFHMFKNGKVAALFNSEHSTDLKKSDLSDYIKSYKKNKYGINLSYNTLRNDLLFPEKFVFDIDGFYALRKTDTDKNNQIIASLKINYLWKISSRNYLSVQNQSGLINSDMLYKNELFRLGGLKTIRGIDEESIPASAYSIINMEYRYKTNADSYFYALTDLALLKDQIYESTTNIFGFGLGYSFLTKAGHIDLAYALGKFKNEPVSFNNSRLHFKIVNFF